MDSADLDPDHDDLDTKKCFIRIKKLEINVDDYVSDSSSSSDLPTLSSLSYSPITSKQESEKTEENENEDNLSASPVSHRTQYQKKIFLVHDTLQFFNSRDVTPSKCGFENILNYSNPITEYEKEMSSFKRVEFEHVISSFLFSSYSFCISDLKSFTTYLLRNLSIHLDITCVVACSTNLIYLLNQHPDAKNLSFTSAEIFTILFNYGTDIDSFPIFQEWPDVLESLEQSDRRKKDYEIPERWTINFKFTIKALMKVISTCKFQTRDLIKTLVYLLWISLDSTLQKENLYSYVQECINVALEQFPEEKWNEVLGDVSKTLLSLKFSSKQEKFSSKQEKLSPKQEKWNNLSEMIESIPNKSKRGVHLRKLASLYALKCLTLQICDLSLIVLDVHEFRQILEQLSDVDSELLCYAVKFVDICVKHLNTKENYEELLNVLKKCVANISDKAHDAKTHLMKIYTKLKIFSGGHVNKVSVHKSLSRKIKEEKFLEEYIENEPNFSNIDEVDQVDDVHDTTIISTKIKLEQNYKSSVGFTACDYDEETLNSLILMTSLHFETETQSQLSPGLVKDEYSRRSIKEEMNIKRESTSGSYEEKQINFTSRCHDTLPIIASERPESENLVAEYESKLPKIMQIKSEFDIDTEQFTCSVSSIDNSCISNKTASSIHVLDPVQNVVVYSASESTHEPTTDCVPDENTLYESSFLEPIIAEVKSISSNNTENLKQSDNCLADVVCDSNEFISDRNFIQESPSLKFSSAEIKSIAPSDTKVLIEQPEICVSNLQQLIPEVKAISSSNTKSLKQSSNCLADVVCDSELISNRNFIQETPSLKFCSAEIKSIAPSDTKVLIEQPEICVSNLQQLIPEVKAISSNNNTKCLKQSANNLPDVVCDSNEFMSNRNFIQEPPSLKFSSAVIKPVVPSGTKVSIEQPEISASNLTCNSCDTNVLDETSLHQSISQEPFVVDVDSLSRSDKAAVRQSSNSTPDLLNNFVKELVTDENSIYHSLLPEISTTKTKLSLPDNEELLESFSSLTSDLQIQSKNDLELSSSSKNVITSSEPAKNSLSDVTNFESFKLNPNNIDKNHETESQPTISYPKELKVFSKDNNFLALKNDDKMLDVDCEKTTEVNIEQISEIDVEKGNSNVDLQSVENCQPISILSDYSQKKRINQPTQIKMNYSSNHFRKQKSISLEKAWHSHMLPTARKSFPNKNNNNQKRKNSELYVPSSKRSNFNKYERNGEILCVKYIKSQKKNEVCLSDSDEADITELCTNPKRSAEEECLSDSDESDIIELYTDPKRYADKECIVIYEPENIVVLD